MMSAMPSTDTFPVDPAAPVRRTTGGARHLLEHGTLERPPERRVLLTFIDVEEPLANVYCDTIPTGRRLPAPGEVWDFGLDDQSSMRGAWRVLSLERPWKDGQPDPFAYRVNIQRVNLEPKLAASIRFEEWTRKFVVAGVFTADIVPHVVRDLTEIFEEVALRA